MDNTFGSRVGAGLRVVEEQVGYFCRRFGKVGSTWKSDGSRVTEADLEISAAFAVALLGAYPEDQFLSEELEHGEEAIEVGSEYAWLLDPIDGTNNYARGVPTCGISLGLLRFGMPVYGYIYDHASRSVVHGGPGLGLWIGGEAYERPAVELMAQSLVCIQSLATDEAMRDEDALQRRFKMRAMGSSALHMAYAALGWTDGVMAHSVKSWDIAAGVALMQAAGGCTRFFDTEVFPVRLFTAKAKGFGHIAGMPETCDAIEKATGRRCAFAV